MNKFNLIEFNYSYECDEITYFEHPLVILFNYLQKDFGKEFAVLRNKIVVEIIIQIC